MKILFIKGTPLSKEASSSLEVAYSFLQSYKNLNPDDKIIELDIFNTYIPEIDSVILAAFQKLEQEIPLNKDEADKILVLNSLLDEFINADKYIIQSPMYNLGIPSKLKSYIDAICVKGKTFQYSQAGPEGLLKGKKAIHFHGCGGMYSTKPSIEHSDSYITNILQFLGIETVPTIWVEGIDFNPSKKNIIIKEAKSKAKDAAKIF